MRCENCEKPMILKTGQEYRYTESGLDNVYLANIELEVCESCGVVNPRIPRIKELHATIALAIVLKPGELKGAELRFLRKQLGYKAKEWATFLHIDVSTLSRWENNERDIGMQSDILARYLYVRLLEEKECRLVQGNISAHLASVVEDGPTDVFVNMNNPAVYHYKQVCV